MVHKAKNAYLRLCTKFFVSYVFRNLTLNGCSMFYSLSFRTSFIVYLFSITVCFE